MRKKCNNLRSILLMCVICACLLFSACNARLDETVVASGLPTAGSFEPTAFDMTATLDEIDVTEPMVSATIMDTENSDPTVETVIATIPVVSASNEFDDSLWDASVVDETVYANTQVNIRKGPDTNYEKVGSLFYGESIHRIAIGSDGWSQVEYNGDVCYMFSEYIQLDEPVAPYTGAYPMTYSDDGVSITITKEWYGDSNVYAAHVVLSDYGRFTGEYLGGAYLSSAAAGKILAINGDWASPNGYTQIRGGSVIVENNIPEGAYSADTGELWYAQRGYSGATETFCFGPAFLIDGSICNTGVGGAAQRTFIGTNGTPGDLWLVVSDGRGYGDSVGLSMYECAAYLQSKGCTFGVPLDGGGSTEMVFQGQILNAIDGERALNDALYITY